MAHPARLPDLHSRTLPRGSDLSEAAVPVETRQAPNLGRKPPRSAGSRSPRASGRETLLTPDVEKSPQGVQTNRPHMDVGNPRPYMAHTNHAVRYVGRPRSGSVIKTQ